MVTRKEKKIYFADINEEIDINKVEKKLENILEEKIYEIPSQFQNEWDELQKIKIIIKGYKEDSSENEEEEKKVQNIYEEIEKKMEETYFQIEKKMSEIEEKIGESFDSIGKLNEYQKQYLNLERITKTLNYKEGEEDIIDGKNICKERIEELRKKIRSDYRKQNEHDIFIREKDEVSRDQMKRKERRYQKKIIKIRIKYEKNPARKKELEGVYSKIKK